MITKEQKKEILRRCKESPTYFIENFCKIKHANAGIIPFRLFKYQKASIKKFQENDRLIYLKCRQSGISTLTGAYSLWTAMFHPNKKILIVSKRDEDAIGYLDRNIKFVYENLPSEIFHCVFGDPRSGINRRYPPPKLWNEHTVGFFHGSEIKSLTSSKDTLRSNTASLVIIDEAAFIPEMESMWTSGQPTLMHGGRVIVISTTNGRGGWYHNTIEDAKEHKNSFEVIEIPWYNMDWSIEYTDDITKRKIRIAPCDGITKCVTEEDKARYGEYKSPWLEIQYRELQEKGEPWKFRQEILMEFIGAGNTVLDTNAIIRVSEEVDSNFKVVERPISYVNPNLSEKYYLDFAKCLWIWNMPERRRSPIIDALSKIIKPGDDGHRYVIGADVSTGESTDYHAAEIIDVTSSEQVAELKIRCTIDEYSRMLDYLGRYYNNALLVVERTGVGEAVLQDLRNILYYQNLFYRRLPNGKKDKKPGFPTGSTTKGFIVKAITENIGAEDNRGIKFKSSRLIRELNCFIHLGNGRIGNEPGAGNNDDLVIAAGLACMAIVEAMQTPDGLLPVNSKNITDSIDEKIDATLDDMIQKGGHGLMYPIMSTSDESLEKTSEEMIMQFVTQLGGISPEMIEKKKALLPVKPSKKYF
jgi:hypothetical protein